MDNGVYFPHMATVQEASKASGLAQCHIRKLLAEGPVRGVRAGRRILVNLDSLSKYLEMGDQPEVKTVLPGIRRINQ